MGLGDFMLKFIRLAGFYHGTRIVLCCASCRDPSGGGYSPRVGAIAPVSQKWGLFRGLLAPALLLN